MFYLILLFFVLEPATRAAPGGSAVADPSVICPRAVRAPVIDGRLNDACWQSGPVISELMLPASGGSAKENTQVYLAHSPLGLYVGFRCAEPRMEALKLTEHRYTWRNDSVEVTIDPDRDRRGYFQFVVDAAGHRLQLADGLPGESPDWSWSAPWLSAASREQGAWCAELFIPAHSLGIRFREGLALRANFARNEQGLLERSSWGPRVGSFVNALHFGNVTLGDSQAALVLTSNGPPLLTSAVASVDVSVRNAGKASITFAPLVSVIPPGIGVGSVSLPRVTLAAGRTARLAVDVPLPDGPQCGLDLWTRVEGRSEPALLTSYKVTVPPRAQLVPGAVLATERWGSIWEACATSKVMSHSPIPRETRQAINVSCARNEFEAFQIVVTPSRELRGLRARVSDLTGSGRLAGDLVSVRLVERVPVKEPTGSDCVPDDYPDPLVPLSSASAPAGRNTALWFTVHVPPDAASGDYRGTVTLEAEGIEALAFPLQLHVWRFTLPKLSHLRTAYGWNLDALCRWHGVSGRENERMIAELTNQNFIDHRVAPFRPMSHYDIKLDRSNGEVRTDFSEFDIGAQQFLPRMNSFNLPGAWMGRVGGLGPSDPGYRETKVAFLKQLASHLREKGWLEKGYCYIYDEPRQEDYTKVISEAGIWREADPALKILLTEQPEKELFGSVDIWTPVLDAYNARTCRPRQAEGEDVWWYVCTGPKHPFPNNFIDYPAIDHRVLHWMNWTCGVTGVLYWQTMFWTSDPWNDTMSRDERGKPFGNGDGVLLYPAVRKPSERPLITGPLDSVRWEMVREGIEDYDYLKMLSDRVTAAERRGEKSPRVNAGKAALARVREVVGGLTDYNRDPRVLLSVRRSVAEALERFE